METSILTGVAVVIDGDCWAGVCPAVEVPAALAPPLAEAVSTASTKTSVLQAGTLLPIDRIAADRPFYSGSASKTGWTCKALCDLPDCCGRQRSARRRPRHPGALDRGIIAPIEGVGVKC